MSVSESAGAGQALSQAEAFARIRLLRSPNIGPVSYRQLLRRFGDARNAIEALPEIVGPTGRTYSAAPRDRIEREIAATRATGARYLFHDSPEYPELLRRMEGAPAIFTVRGEAALAAQPCVALVGARNASAAAVKLAREFGAALSQAGLTVVSGLARGIDGAAHRGALPRTIGVIASGINIAYPPEHESLQEQIACEGLLVAEEPTGSGPRGNQFPRRNRIIAGLSLGTLVIEAAPRSGSLITARMAGEAGREVMAIPGSPLEPRSHGCNQLIRDGAALVQTPEDVIELLSGFDGEPRSTYSDNGTAVREAEELVDDEPASISDLLTTAPIGVDELIRQSGESASAVQLALLELEVAGLLERHAGGRVSLATRN